MTTKSYKDNACTSGIKHAVAHELAAIECWADSTEEKADRIATLTTALVATLVLALAATCRGKSEMAGEVLEHTFDSMTEQMNNALKAARQAAKIGNYAAELKKRRAGK